MSATKDPVPHEEKSDKDYMEEVEEYLGECKKALTTEDPHGEVSSAGLQAHYTELERRAKRAQNSGFLSVAERMEGLARRIKTYKVVMETRGMGKGVSYRLRKAPKKELYWVVEKDKKFSKDPLPRERAEAQRKALYANTGGVSIPKKEFIKEHKNLLGVLKRGKRSELSKEAKDQANELIQVLEGGSWRDIFSPSRILNEAFNPDSILRRGIRDATTPSKIINEVVNPDSIVRRRISDVSKGIRVGFSPSARKVIEKYGAWLIDVLVIRRVPIQSALHTAFQLITLGRWNSALAEENKDKLFHLGIMVSVKKDNQQQYIIIEKNEVVNVAPTSPSIQGQEILNGNVPPNTTLAEFLEKGVSSVGDVRFFKYDPFTNNCQDFVGLLLSANGVYSEQARDFTKQNIDDLVVKLPNWTHAVAKGITDLGGIANVALEGGAKPHSKFDKQLRKVGYEPSLYLKEAQRRAKDAGLPHKVLGFADDGIHKLSIPNADGRMIKFGRVGYGDHLIWSHLEQHQKAPKGTADAKRNTFQKSHSAIKGDWKKDPFSPNSLALKVLW